MGKLILRWFCFLGVVPFLVSITFFVFMEGLPFYAGYERFEKFFFFIGINLIIVASIIALFSLIGIARLNHELYFKKFSENFIASRSLFPISIGTVLMVITILTDLHINPGSDLNSINEVFRTLTFQSWPQPLWFYWGLITYVYGYFINLRESNLLWSIYKTLMQSFVAVAGNIILVLIALTFFSTARKVSQRN